MSRPQPRLSRRALLLGGAGTALGWGLRRFAPVPTAAAIDRALRMAVAPQGTTLEATIVPVGAGPYRTTGEGPGEPTMVRTDLAEPTAGREDRRVALGALVHFTDQHLVDAQSPGRVEFLDPLDSLFGGAYRPQELLTCQIATSMVEHVNALGRAPLTGRRFDAVVCTGDNIDNQQVNELRWLVDILDGGTITPDSGALGSYEGVQDAVDPKPHWWHPDAGVADDYKATLGYPDIPGLLDASIAPFTSPGLDVPWYSVYGNHDCNVQGNAARTDALDDVFVGDRKMVALPAGEGAIPFILRVMGDSPSVLADLQSGAIPSRQVTADDDRRTATIDDWIGAHLASPTGTHGYGAADLAADRLYYEFDVAPGVVGIAMDSTNHLGGPDGAGGSIGEGQLRWLEERLAAHHVRHLAPDGSGVRSGGDDRLVVVFSHHTSGTMQSTDRDPARPDEDRIQGAELVQVLLRYPNVVAWVNGHTHTNEVVAHRPPAGRRGGFWEISTASHVDWPQQARIIEVADNADGTLSLLCTMIEHAAPATVDHAATDPVGLAGIARELGLNDATAGPQHKTGGPEDRNVELVLRTPFTAPIVDPPTAPPPTAPPAAPVPGDASYTG